jgi:hypothetical protein
MDALTEVMVKCFREKNNKPFIPPLPQHPDELHKRGLSRQALIEEWYPFSF